MLISKEETANILKQHGIIIEGALHVGAHECEEIDFYGMLGLKHTDIIWIEAITEKVNQMKSRGIPNIYEAVISDKDDKLVDFCRTNNDQSSSILPLGTHAEHYKHIYVTERTQKKTVTLDTFFAKENIDYTKMHIWNFDIQGAELQALRGAELALPFAKAIYLEVNVEEVYKGCALMSEIDTFLGERGFERVRTELVREGWGDALYLRKMG